VLNGVYDTVQALIPTTMGTPRTSREKLEAAIRDDNEAFIQAQTVRQSQMRKDEDEHLDHLERGLGKLGEMSLTIRDELEDQDELLDRFQNEVTSTSNRVSAGIKKISELIDRSSTRTSWLIIMGLVGIILFLLFVVFFL
jgi:t-SNARE complex subunit (syntaxin)